MTTCMAMMANRVTSRPRSRHLVLQKMVSPLKAAWQHRVHRRFQARQHVAPLLSIASSSSMSRVHIMLYLVVLFRSSLPLHVRSRAVEHVRRRNRSCNAVVLLCSIAQRYVDPHLKSLQGKKRLCLKKNTAMRFKPNIANRNRVRLLKSQPKQTIPTLPTTKVFDALFFLLN